MTQILKFITALSLLFLTTTLNSQITKLKSIEGSWESVGYGYVIDVKNEQIQMYDYCKLACTPNLVFGYDEFDNTFQFLDIQTNSFTIKEGVTEYDFKRIDQLPDLCTQVDVKKNEDPLYNFDTLWEHFNEQFAYFKERNVDWNEMKEKYRSRITSKTKPFDLFIAMHEMVSELNDGHSNVFPPESLEGKYAKYQKKKRNERRKDLGYKPKPINVDNVRRAVISNYVKEVKSYLFGNINWGITDDNIAIVQINGMAMLANYDIPEDATPEEAQAYYERQYEASENNMLDEVHGTRFIMDSILKDIKNTRTCILDIRFNGGGFDPVGMEILKSFGQKKDIVFRKNTRDGDGFTRTQTIEMEPIPHAYKGEIYMLTSTQSASAAESFAMAMKALCPNIVIVGSETTGIFSDMIEKKLPNGWDFSLSTEVYFDKDGKNYEGIGILPDHRIEYDRKGYWFYDKVKRGIEENGKDEAIEKVMSLLK